MGLVKLPAERLLSRALYGSLSPPYSLYLETFISQHFGQHVPKVVVVF